MPTKQAITDALHSYLDDVEDIQLDVIEELTRLLGKLPLSAWAKLSQPGAVRALADQISVQLTTSTLGKADALSTKAVQAMAGQKFSAAIDTLSKSTSDKPSRYLDNSTVGASARQMSLAIEAPLTDASNKIERLLSGQAPKTKADAEFLLKRIETEIISPLTKESGWREAMREPVQGMTGETLSFASIKLRDPKTSPENAAQIALDRPMTWIAALVNTCPDCLPRHGQTKPMAQWKLMGLPRSGWSVCGRHCKCQLIPDKDLGSPGVKELIDPLRRESARTLDKKLGGLSVRVPDKLLAEDPANLKASAARSAKLREAYADDLRVRRAMRMLGSVNAPTTRG